MHSHAIIEVEEGALNVVVGGRDGAATRVSRSLRLPLAATGKDAVTRALQSVPADVFSDVDGVHVVLGDRRAQHFLSAIPPMAARDAVAFVQREAVRLGSFSSAEDVLVSTRLVRRTGGRRFLLATCALPRSAWRGIGEALAARGLEVKSLQTMESCLAQAMPSWTSEPTALVECNGNRARFVLAVDQCPVQVRRFLIGGGDQNGAAMAMQFAMELPRTLDWLRESGQPLPRRLLLGARVTIDDDASSALGAGELEHVQRAPVGVTCDPELPTPSLAVSAVLERVAAGGPVDSLLAPPRLSLPVGRGLVATLAVAAVATAVLGYAAVVDTFGWLAARGANGGLAEQRDGVEQELLDLADSLDEGAPRSARLVGALTMRRPLSRLVGELGAGAGHGVLLDELTFGSTTPVAVRGHVHGVDRADALAAMARFVDAVHRLPYLESIGREEVQEVAGRPGHLRFQLTLGWRNE